MERGGGGIRILQFVRSKLSKLGKVVTAIGNSLSGLCERVRVVSDVIFDMSFTSALAVMLNYKISILDFKKLHINF